MPQGLAALRLWGQTGKPPRGWVAAADPVYLEPMLDHIRLHRFTAGELSTPELQSLFSDLQATLGSDGDVNFSCIAEMGYLARTEGMCTAAASSVLADGARPEELLPAGEAAQEHDRLLGEIQLFLHTHALNDARREYGRRPANSLWIWGGGPAEQHSGIADCRLYADDALFRGYWHSSSGELAPWPGSIRQCLESASGRAVVVPSQPLPGGESESLQSILCELRQLLGGGRIASLCMIFGDGGEVALTRRDRYKFWRRPAPAAGA